MRGHSPSHGMFKFSEDSTIDCRRSYKLCTSAVYKTMFVHVIYRSQIIMVISIFSKDKNLCSIQSRSPNRWKPNLYFF